MRLNARFFLVLLALYSSASMSTEYGFENLTIGRVRAVGDYAGTTFDNTVELWFVTPLSFPAQSPCTVNGRVYIDKKNEHLVSAAYMAFVAGKKVNINVDSTLPNRNGSCEISFLDVIY